VSARAREALADWLMALAAPLLLGSEFLTWSHQVRGQLAARYGTSAALAGVPRDPTAWQVYSTVDVLLALVAAGLAAVALWGGRVRRRVLFGGLLLGLAFTAHALAAAPRNGVLVFAPSTGRYIDPRATAGVGEWVALVALVVGTAGAGLSMSADAAAGR
jgi:hypothetical protein